MPKLADEIDILRRRMVEESEGALNQLDHLERRLLTGDAEVMRKIESIIALQERNAVDIVKHLQIIASRVGHLPRPATPDDQLLGDEFEIHSRHRHVAPPNDAHRQGLN